MIVSSEVLLRNGSLAIIDLFVREAVVGKDVWEGPSQTRQH